MKSIRKIAATMVALLAYGSVCLSQEMPSVVPPAPEAASLGKYTDMPVNYSSGLPQISIPMFTASSRDISVPVSLSYHAGGIRVEEIASRAGLGWNLQAGGIITRSVRGAADDKGLGGWLNARRSIADFEAADNTTKLGYIDDALNGNDDYEPDIFNFSYPGGGGKFVFDENGDVVTIPASEHKITYTTGAGLIGGISGFVVTNSSGYKYHYGNYGGLHARDSTGTTQSFTDDGETKAGITPGDKDKNHYSSWYLLAIQSPVSDAIITFTYENQTTTSLNRGAQRSMYNATAEQEICPIPSGIRTSYIRSENRETSLKTIHFEHGTINFEYDPTERLDLPGGYALDKVTLKNISGVVLKTFDLVQGYWTSHDNPASDPFLGFDKEHFTKRLYLQKVVEKGEGDVQPKEYLFDYNDANHMAHRFSFAQDVWGFYNGKTNYSLIPSYIERGVISPTPTDQYMKVIPGADRRASTEHSKYYALERITYPTGGTANFEYESNGVYRANSEAFYTNTHFEIEKDTLANYSYDGGANTDVDIGFTVNSSHLDGTMEFNFNTTGCPQGLSGNAVCGLNARIVGVTNPSYLRIIPQEGVENGAFFNLAPGSYKLELDIVGDASAGNEVSTATASIIAFKNNSPYAPREEFEVGGLRILRTRMNDNLGNNLIKEYSYITNEYGVAPGDYGTSGVLATHKWIFKEDNIDFCTSVEQSVSQLTSQNPVTATGTGAGHVVYTKVIETQLPDDGTVLPTQSGITFQHGFSVNQFDFVSDTPHDESESFPFAPYKQVPWMRGNQIKQSTFKKESGLFKQIQLDSIKVEYTTIPGDPLYNQIKALKVDQRGSVKNWAFYYVYTGGNHITRKVSRSTQDNGLVEQSTDYEYNNHYLRPDKTITHHSDGQTSISTTKYTDDSFGTELSNAEKTVLTSMVAANIFSPILSETYAENENTPLAKSLTVFGNETAGYLPVSTKIWNRDTDSFEERLIYEYTDQGNYEHLIKDETQQVAYIWNYGNTRPTAQVTNASSASDIAYTSFESTGKGNWAYTGSGIAGNNLPSGAKYFDISSSAITKTGLDPAKKYLVSYWARYGTPTVNNSTNITASPALTRGGWTYYQHLVTGHSSVQISGTGIIDELRLHPTNTQMSTYTYDPPRGVTSMGTPNNLFTHYIYDEHGRLYMVKDQDGNILKVNTYEYQTPVSNVQN